MPSSYTTSLRFELQFTGENVNLWGDKLNAALSRADDAIAGWLSKALTGDYTLSTANGAADEARKAMLKFTGTGAFTVTVPAVAKRYDVWNACTGDLTVTNGSASVAVKPGEVVSVVTDGGGSIARVQGNDFDLPTSNRQAATKKYVDDTAFAIASGSLPGQTGNAGKFLTTDGSIPEWSDVFASPTITTPTIAGGALVTGSMKQNAQALVGASIDVSVAEFFSKTISTNTSLTFIGAAASKAQAFILELTVSSSAVPSWPANVDWSGAVAPTIPNGRNLLAFVTLDGGTSWAGIPLALELA